MSSITAQEQSLQTSPIPADELSAETVLSVRWADPSLLKMATDSVHLFNSYFPVAPATSGNYLVAYPRTVVVHAVETFESNELKIGSVYQDASNGTWIVHIKTVGQHSVFNTLVHEMAHVLVRAVRPRTTPPNASLTTTATGCRLSRERFFRPPFRTTFLFWQRTRWSAPGMKRLRATTIGLAPTATVLACFFRALSGSRGCAPLLPKRTLLRLCRKSPRTSTSRILSSTERLQ